MASTVDVVVGSPASDGGRLAQLALAEHLLVCRLANRICNRAVILLLVGVSRFGDWGLSAVAAMVLLALDGPQTVVLFITATGTGILVQKLLKHSYGRTRPCERPDGPPQRAPIPDRGSFPSGHTLHAVMAAVTVTALAPAAAPPFLLVAPAMAASRVILGVHYPSDVAAGAGLGAVLGASVCLLVS